MVESAVKHVMVVGLMVESAVKHVIVGGLTVGSAVNSSWYVAYCVE